MQSAAESVRETSVPLAVDLDGTLIRTDTLWESLAQLLRQRPLALLAVPYWWVRGRAFLKQQLAQRTKLDVRSLPFNEAFLAWLNEEKQSGRQLVLATASDRQLASAVARHTGLFDAVLASDGKTNLRDEKKLRALKEKFGERGFDYAGNSGADLEVWSGAREAIVVSANGSLIKRAGERAKVSRTFFSSGFSFKAFVRCLRPHQWSKNLIVFVPVLTAHALGNSSILIAALRTFAAFCCCASAAYLLNDLMDLEADRHHPNKRQRPFASGDLPLPVAFVAAPLLLITGLALTLGLPAAATAAVACYFVATSTYSWKVKRVPLLDVFFLAGLYTSRLIAGHLATGVAWSVWLLVFSMFIFLSLALVKRLQELQAVREQNGQDVKGRGYVAGDLELVTMLGIASGFIAVLVLALYVNSEQVLKLYARPMLLLLACPLLLYWLSRIWFLAHRGQMHDDPTAFACKDWVSYFIGGVTLLVMWLATGR